MTAPDGIDDSVVRAADIRGIAGKTLTPRTALLTGKAFGSFLAGRNETAVYVGRDVRLSSPDLAFALIDGLSSCGLRVVDIGTCPSPVLYFAARTGETGAGVMVTASHNPKEYNGFKFVVDGRPFFGAALKDLARRINDGFFIKEEGSVERKSFKNAYISRVCEDFAAGRPLRAVWDCANGTAALIVPHLTERLTGEHILLNAAPDGNFPAHAPDTAKAEYLRQLRDTVLETGADIGFAFDGDADRLGVVNADGDIVPTDAFLQLFAEEILQTRPNALFVADVKCSRVFADEIARMGGVPVITKTGHAFIKEKMLETGAVLGGERSGHVCFADKYHGFDDAIYAAVRLLSLAQRIDLPARLKRIPPSFMTEELTFPAADDEKFAVMDRLKKALREKDVCFDDTDGVQIKEDGGRYLLRASNTVPALLGLAEADSAERCAALKEKLTALAAFATGLK